MHLFTCNALLASLRLQLPQARAAQARAVSSGTTRDLKHGPGEATASKTLRHKVPVQPTESAATLRGLRFSGNKVLMRVALSSYKSETRVALSDQGL